MALSKLEELLLGQLAQVVSLAGLALVVLPAAGHPHVDCGGDAEDLEGDAGADAGDVLGPVFEGEDDGGDDAAELAAGDGEGGEGAALDVADDLVDAAGVSAV